LERLQLLKKVACACFWMDRVWSEMSNRKRELTSGICGVFSGVSCKYCDSLSHSRRVLAPLRIPNNAAIT